MGSKTLPLLKGASSFISFSTKLPISIIKFRNSSSAPVIRSSLQPPDLPRLAHTSRISLSSIEVQEFAPKITQVVDWFGQLQAVDLQSVEPSIRADTEGDNQRSDIPETFENREAIIGAVPVFDETYIKVPKVLNKE